MRPTLFIVLGMATAIAVGPVLAAGQTPNVTLSSLIGFSIAAHPDSVSIQTGASVNLTVTVSSQGLNGPVSFDAAVSPSSGPTAVMEPSSVIVLPGGSTNSTLEIDAISTQPGLYNIVVTGSSLLAPSESAAVTANVTNLPSNPSPSPPGGSTSSGPSGPNNQQPSTTTSGSNPKGPLAPRGQGPQSIFDPVGVLVAGNLLAAVATAATTVSFYRKRSRSSPSISDQSAFVLSEN